MVSSDSSFWKGRSILVTGHTGFKGSWLALWLHAMGARVHGIALSPETEPSLFTTAQVERCCERSTFCDIRDAATLERAVLHAQPEMVFHMAAQALVRRSYAQPVETYATNVMGTLHLLEATRKCRSTRCVIAVTSDKCYRNKEWVWGYRESDELGGHDPYSNSKACAEVLLDGYRSSFLDEGAFLLASVRAGNVIGGGDWSADRLVPDLIRALQKGDAAAVRNPSAVRPWQHVLEPLAGYLLLAERLLGQDGRRFAEAWNFGPGEDDIVTVEKVSDEIHRRWHDSASAWQRDTRAQPHEARILRLDTSKATQTLGWKRQLQLGTALDWTVEWYRAFGADAAKAQAITHTQIERYMALQRNG